ncbi:MAG TPA: SRPBCC domain-containing protein [Ktedonobacterales bacterium]
MLSELPPISQTTYIAAPITNVYETLTTSRGWDAWLTTGTTLDARPGGEICLRWHEWGPNHDTVTDHGAVVEALPGRRFAFHWHPGGGTSLVSFDLESLGLGTIVRLTDSGHSSMSTLVACAAGWGEAMALLKMYLEHGVTYGPVPRP